MPIAEIDTTRLMRLGALFITTAAIMTTYLLSPSESRGKNQSSPQQQPWVPSHLTNIDLQHKMTQSTDAAQALAIMAQDQYQHTNIHVKFAAERISAQLLRRAQLFSAFSEICQLLLKIPETERSQKLQSITGNPGCQHIWQTIRRATLTIDVNGNEALDTAARQCQRHLKNV